MAIGSDFTISAGGNIRHTSGVTVYSVLDLHAWLQDLADNAAPIGDDVLSILSSNPSKMDGPRDAASSSRLQLINSYNIDSTAAQYINFGSIKQANGDTLYSGLKTIGAIVTASPVYVVQDGSKLTKYWSDGHIEIMSLVKTGGSLIDSGLVRAYSRKYGQAYSDFEVNLSAGGETAAALNTFLLDWVTLSEEDADALLTKVAITVGDSNHDLGNGNGSKAYKGTITLSGGCTLAEAAQYLHVICKEASTTSIGTTEGWKYRMLNAAYPPSAQSPCGYLAGGTFFVAQGWWLAGVLSAEAKMYQLISHDGQVQIPPNIVSITIGGLLTGDSLFVARDDGAGGYVDDEYTLDGIHNIGRGNVTVNEVVSTDIPSAGNIRVEGYRYEYTSWTGKVFTLSGTLAEQHAGNSPAFVPFLDKTSTGTSESVTIIYSSAITGRVKVRCGSGGSPIIPFETTFDIGSSGGGTNAIRNSDV